MSDHILLRTGGVYAELHERIFGARPRAVRFEIKGLTPLAVEEARRAWQERIRREFAALRASARFLTEVVGCGDPLEVYGAALEGLQYKIRRVALCATACEAFGAAPVLPGLDSEDDAWPNRDAPMSERAVATALACLAINDTLRYAYVEDLFKRCRVAHLYEGLEEILEGREVRERFAWTYVQDGIHRFPPSYLAEWRHLVEVTLAPHRRKADEALADVPEDKRTLEAWPEEDRAALGIFSPQRHALVFQKVYQERLLPKLRELELL